VPGRHPNLTHFVIHPAADSPELRAITATRQSRVADYRAFSSDEPARWVKDCDIQIIGYRLLRDLMRQVPTSRLCRQPRGRETRPGGGE
jgi:hypothetical protein